MHVLLSLLLLALIPSAWATKVEPMPLEEMVQEATQIAVATSESTYGRTKNGSVLFVGKFRTGPGLGNVLVSRMKILRVLRGDALSVGEIRDIEFWPMWHMETDLAVKAEPYPVILMLKKSRNALVPVFEPDPWVDGRLESRVRELLK